MRWIMASIVLLLAGTGALFAQGKGVRFWNLTSSTISGFQLSPAGKNEWGPNQTLNDNDKKVDHDERLRITGVEPGRYDAKLTYPDMKQCVVRDIEIKADAVFSIMDKGLKDCTKQAFSRLASSGSAGRCRSACLCLVVGVRIFAMPFDCRPFRVLAYPLGDIGRRRHRALRQ